MKIKYTKRRNHPKKIKHTSNKLHKRSKQYRSKKLHHGQQRRQKQQQKRIQGGNHSAVKHVIVLMFENRSFDQMFGYLEGIQDDLYFNVNEKGETVHIKSMPGYEGEDDLPHDLDATLKCINGTTNRRLAPEEVPEANKMSGFVFANNTAMIDADNSDHSKPLPQQHIMSYYPQGSYPVFDFLADHYVVCNQWFASCPTCTQPNRAFALCGTSQGHINNTNKGLDKKLLFTCDTIMDRLNAKKVKWNWYYNDATASLLMTHLLEVENLARYKKFQSFVDDVAHNALPAVSFIDPFFGIEASSEINHNIYSGQNLVATIYDTLRSNPEIWNSSVFFIYYDECGGYYDHVHPPRATPPDHHTQDYDFHQYGPRVPAMVISPLLNKGKDNTLYDHTSILKLIETVFGLDHLTERDKNANSIADKLLASPRTNLPTNSARQIVQQHAFELGEATIRKHDAEFFKNMAESLAETVLFTNASLIEEVKQHMQQLGEEVKTSAVKFGRKMDHLTDKLGHEVRHDVEHHLDKLVSDFKQFIK